MDILHENKTSSEMYNVLAYIDEIVPAFNQNSYLDTTIDVDVRITLEVEIFSEKEPPVSV